MSLTSRSVHMNQKFWPDGSNMFLFAVHVVLLFALPVQAQLCCTADQWEGHIREITGYVQDSKGHLLNGSISLSYDYTNLVSAISSNLTLDGKLTMVKIIQNYKTGMMDSITGKVCTSTKLPGDMMKLCLPDISIPLGTVYYGQGKNILMANLFLIPYEKSTSIYSTVTTGNPCLPIADVVFGTPAEVPTVSSVEFQNITTGIKDPSVFTPPSSCSGNTASTEAPVIDHRLMIYMMKKMIG